MVVGAVGVISALGATCHRRRTLVPTGSGEVADAWLSARKVGQSVVTGRIASAAGSGVVPRSRRSDSMAGLSKLKSPAGPRLVIP
jgi:uncharacterized protein YidB (DUF937 family)